MAHYERGRIVHDHEPDDDLTPEQDVLRRAHIAYPVAAAEAEARRATDPDVAAGWQRIADQHKRRIMSTKYTAATEALKGLADIDAAIKSVAAREATGEINLAFANHERQRLRIEASHIDANARALRDAAISESLAEARALRATAAVGTPESTTADELLRARLMAEPYTGDRYLDQGLAMLNAGQPGRAAVLLDVARLKGATVTADVALAVEDALDAAVPERAEARKLEQAVEVEQIKYAAARAKLLAESLGETENGQIGTGQPSEQAAAARTLSLATYAATTVAGEAS